MIKDLKSNYLYIVLSFPFARRYLFGKKSTSAINIISGVSILGISVGTAALILVMSVLNGFEGLIKGLINTFNADLKIVLIQGKTFTNDSNIYKKISSIDHVTSVIPYLEETAMLEYKGVNDFTILRGVDSSYTSHAGIVNNIDEGQFQLRNEYGYTAVLGVGIRNKLAVSVDDPFVSISAYMPDPSGNALRPFKKRSLTPAGIFSGLYEYDNKYTFVDLQFIQELINKPNEITGYEIRLDDYKNKDVVQKAVHSILGDSYSILDRYQQDASFYKLMNLEKWVSYAILSFVLVLVAFNIIGALWMIVLDKKKDIMILKSMGMRQQNIRAIFLQTGMLIVGIGIISGFIIALVLYFIQQKYTLIPMPPGFLVDKYPIALQWTDFIVVSVTVSVIGFIASILPAKKAALVEEAIRYE